MVLQKSLGKLLYNYNINSYRNNIVPVTQERKCRDDMRLRIVYTAVKISWTVVENGSFFGRWKSTNF